MNQIRIQRIHKYELDRAIQEKLNQGYTLVKKGEYQKNVTQKMYYAIFLPKERVE